MLNHLTIVHRITVNYRVEVSRLAVRVGLLKPLQLPDNYFLRATVVLHGYDVNGTTEQDSHTVPHGVSTGSCLDFYGYGVSHSYGCFSRRVFAKNTVYEITKRTY